MSPERLEASHLGDGVLLDPSSVGSVLWDNNISPFPVVSPPLLWDSNREANRKEKYLSPWPSPQRCSALSDDAARTDPQDKYPSIFGTSSVGI